MGKKVSSIVLLISLSFFSLFAQVNDNPRLAVFGFINQTGDDAFTIPSDTATKNLLTTLRTLSLFQIVETDTIPRSFTESSLDQWCVRNNVDYIMYGTVVKLPDERQQYLIAYYSRSEKKIIHTETEIGETVRDVFSILDTLIDSMLGTITKNKVSFGSLQIKNTGLNLDYDVYLNDIFIQTNPVLFERVPTGLHSIRIVQKATGVEVLSKKVTIFQGATDIVEFDLREPTAAEIATAAQNSIQLNLIGAPGTYSEGLIDGAAMATESTTPYFFAGCCLGVIGIIIPAVAEPTVPGDPIMGKSSDYIQGFRESYKDKTKSRNLRAAVIGFGASTCVGTLAYVGFVFYAASLATSGTMY